MIDEALFDAEEGWRRRSQSRAMTCRPFAPAGPTRDVLAHRHRLLRLSHTDHPDVEHQRA